MLGCSLSMLSRSKDYISRGRSRSRSRCNRSRISDFSPPIIRIRERNSQSAIPITYTMQRLETHPARDCSGSRKPLLRRQNYQVCAMVYLTTFTYSDWEKKKWDQGAYSRKVLHVETAVTIKLWAWKTFVLRCRSATTLNGCTCCPQIALHGHDRMLYFLSPS
jgi:hypothetical protein